LAQAILAQVALSQVALLQDACYSAFAAQGSITSFWYAAFSPWESFRLPFTSSGMHALYMCIHSSIPSMLLFVGSQHLQNSKFRPAARVAHRDTGTAIFVQDEESNQDGLGSATRPSAGIDIGEAVVGTVTKIENRGACVSLGLDKPGFIHISMFQDELVENISDIVSIGDEVKARVKKVEKTSIQLSVKHRPEFDKRPLTDFKDGDEVDAEVLRTTKTRKGHQFVVYFDIGAMIDAFAVYNSEPNLEPGSKVKVRVEKARRHGTSVVLV